jgi:hypothetical protein
MKKESIFISNGKGKKKEFFLWDYYETKEEATMYARKLKKQCKGKTNLKYFILAKDDSWFLPVKSYGVYFSKDVREIV